MFVYAEAKEKTKIIIIFKCMIREAENDIWLLLAAAAQQQQSFEIKVKIMLWFVDRPAFSTLNIRFSLPFISFNALPYRGWSGWQTIKDKKNVLATLVRDNIGVGWMSLKFN